MRTVIVRYRVRPDAAAENERLIGAVLAQLERDKPANMRYQVFKAADGVSFTHISTAESAEANPLTKLEAFKAFSSTIKERVEEGPVTTEVAPIAAYDGFTG